jgi:hypothetical protein
MMAVEVIRVLCRFARIMQTPMRKAAFVLEGGTVYESRAVNAPASAPARPASHPSRRVKSLS